LRIIELDSDQHRRSRARLDPHFGVLLDMRALPKCQRQASAGEIGKTRRPVLEFKAKLLSVEADRGLQVGHEDAYVLDRMDLGEFHDVSSLLVLEFGESAAALVPPRSLPLSQTPKMVAR
jgi:hypothetical protein